MVGKDVLLSIPRVGVRNMSDDDDGSDDADNGDDDDCDDDVAADVCEIKFPERNCNCAVVE